MPERIRNKFSEVFDQRSDGSLLLKKAFQISDNPTVFEVGTTFQKGVAYGGIDFSLYVNRDIAFDLDVNSDGPLKLIGFFVD